MTAYGLLNHRHTAEMEMALGGKILFTPHLAPMNRGILATCTAIADGPCDPLAGACATPMRTSPSSMSRTARPRPNGRWAPTPSTSPPATTSAPAGCSPRGARQSRKGAAGQMIQCANLMLGLDEDRGPAERAESGRERHRRPGLRRRRLPCRDQASQARHGPARHRRRQAGHRGRRLHPEQVRRAAGRCSTARASPPAAARRRR